MYRISFELRRSSLTVTAGCLEGQEMRKRHLSQLTMILSPVEQHFVVRRYAIALLMTLMAVLLRWLLEPLLGHSSFYATVYMAVLCAALVCGLWPSILTAVLGCLGIVYWFVDPRHSFSVARKTEIHSIFGCILVCTVIVALGEANRRKQLKLNAARDDLECRIKERTSELSKTLVSLAAEVAVRERTEEELRRLSVQIMAVQDEERRRIARDLHDTAGQSLAAMKMTVSALRASGTILPETLQLADDLDALSDEALREIRTTSYLLHPPLLDEAGFASAAKWFVQGFSQRSGIRVDFDLDEDVGPLVNVDIALFRVLQEALTNVHRHSECSVVTVNFALEDTEVVLQIGDNGHGFSADGLRDFTESRATVGVGLPGMRERVRQLGGALEVQSNQTGTRLQARIPITAEQQAPRINSHGVGV